MTEAIIQIRQVSCRFGDVLALDNVDLDIYPGEVLALLGENGAGKSTLMKLLYGINTAASGEVFIDGKISAVRNPTDAMELGIGMMFQHFSLLPALSVRDNLLIAWPNTPLWIGQRNPATRTVLHELKNIAPNLSPNKLVAQLSVGEQQLVELCKIMNIRARVVILDEPTSVLTPQEARKLHAFVRSLAERGVAVVFITHKLEDVEASADRVAVMRKGKLVETFIKGEHNASSMVSQMMGSDSVNNPSRVVAKGKKGSKRLQLVNLNVDTPGGRLQHINLSVSAGEVVAIAGVGGNGQSQLAEVVAGVLPCASGDVILDGNSIVRKTAAHSVATPLGYIPEQPRENAIVADLDLATNLNLRHYAGMKEPLYDDVTRLLRRFNVNPPIPSLPAGTLSGGNLQKLVIARELGSPRPAILACYPTMGLDLNAIQDVYQQLFAQAEQGAAVLWISEDLDHMLSAAHRIVVMREGQIVADIVNDATLTRDRIGALMTGLHEDDAA